MGEFTDPDDLIPLSYLAVDVPHPPHHVLITCNGRIPLPNGAPSVAETVGAEPPQDPMPSPPSATVASLVINSQVTVNDHDMDELPNGTALAPEAALSERSLEPTQVQEPAAPIEEHLVSVEQPGAASPPPALPSLASAPVESSVIESQESLNSQDEPMSSGKVAREREDDDMDCGPATKRSRTDGDISSAPAAPEFKVPDLPELNTNVTEEQAEPVDSKLSVNEPITKLQHRFILKVIQNIKRTNDAMPFTKPVDIVALNIPTYPTIITKPMDLRTMEEKLKNNQYPSIAVYINDFNQIVENSMSFNGPEHVVTKNALNIKASFEKQMLNLPGPDPPEPPPVEKKKKAPAATTTKATSSRRESRSSLPGSARSPTTAASPTFALGPQGVPLIRRDSTVGDGRPKREIHPPAPRDLPYANQKPKKKKYQLELKFCQHVMNELLKPKHQHIAFPFQLPVDPVALNIPHYHKVIKNPMDLGTVGTKLSRGQYENAKEFEADVRLIFSNCYKFNPASDPVHAMGKNIEAVFDEKLAEKSRWIEANTPASGRQSPGSSPEPEEEEEEEEEEDEDEGGNELAKLQQQIAAMSRQVELITQKKKSPPAAAKKGKGGKTTGKKDTKKNSSAAPAKVEKKATKPGKKEKTPYVTYEQKQDISNRINSLSETRMATALKIIRDNMPNLKV